MKLLQTPLKVPYFEKYCPSIRKGRANMTPHIETSRLVCTANQVTGFYMDVKLT